MYPDNHGRNPLSLASMAADQSLTPIRKTYPCDSSHFGLITENEIQRQTLQNDASRLFFDRNDAEV